MMQKIISIIILFCFTFSFILSDALHAVVEARGASGRFNAVFEGLVIPSSIGRITDKSYLGSGQVVVNIQDLHCHPEVQRNIAKILSMLDEKYKLGKVYIEGASAGKMDTSWLCNIKDKELRLELIETMVDQGKVTGTEYYSIKSGRPEMLYGIEEQGLYKGNLIRLGKILENKDEIDGIIKILKRDLETVKGRYFNSKNKRLERIINRYREKGMEAVKYFKLLKKYSKKLTSNAYDFNNISSIDINKYSNIKGYMDASVLGKKIDYVKTAKQLQQFMGILKQKLPYSSYNNLLNKTDNFTKLDELYIYLPRLVKEFNLDLSINFASLNEFFIYSEMSRDINPLKLISEEKRLIENIRTGLSENVSELEVSFLSDFFLYFEDYLKNRLSAADHEYFNSRFGEFKTLWAKYADKNRLNELDDYFSVLDEYYRVNLARNGCFIGNILADRENNVGNDNAVKAVPVDKNIYEVLDEAQEITVVVTGGFHSEGLQKLLAERNVTFVSITPNVTVDSVKSDKVYIELAKQQAKILSETLSPVPATIIARLAAGPNATEEQVRAREAVLNYLLAASIEKYRKRSEANEIDDKATSDIIKSLNSIEGFKDVKIKTIVDKNGNIERFILYQQGRKTAVFDVKKGANNDLVLVPAERELNSAETGNSGQVDLQGNAVSIGAKESLEIALNSFRVFEILFQDILGDMELFNNFLSSLGSGDILIEELEALPDHQKNYNSQRALWIEDNEIHINPDLMRRLDEAAQRIQFLHKEKHIDVAEQLKANGGVLDGIILTNPLIEEFILSLNKTLPGEIKPEMKQKKDALGKDKINKPIFIRDKKELEKYLNEKTVNRVEIKYLPFFMNRKTERFADINEFIRQLGDFAWAEGIRFLVSVNEDINGKTIFTILAYEAGKDKNELARNSEKTNIYHYTSAEDTKSIIKNGFYNLPGRWTFTTEPDKNAKNAMLLTHRAGSRKNDNLPLVLVFKVDSNRITTQMNGDQAALAYSEDSAALLPEGMNVPDFYHDAAESGLLQKLDPDTIDKEETVKLNVGLGMYKETELRNILGLNEAAEKSEGVKTANAETSLRPDTKIEPKESLKNTIQEILRMKKDLVRKKSELEKRGERVGKIAVETAKLKKPIFDKVDQLEEIMNMEYAEKLNGIDVDRRKILVKNISKLLKNIELEPQLIAEFRKLGLTNDNWNDINNLLGYEPFIEIKKAVNGEIKKEEEIASKNKAASEKEAKDEELLRNSWNEIKKMWFYHGTSMLNLESIRDHGFDSRYKPFDIDEVNNFFLGIHKEFFHLKEPYKRLGHAEKISLTSRGDLAEDFAKNGPEVIRILARDSALMIESGKITGEEYDYLVKINKKYEAWLKNHVPLVLAVPAFDAVSEALRFKLGDQEYDQYFYGGIAGNISGDRLYGRDRGFLFVSYEAFKFHVNEETRGQNKEAYLKQLPKKLEAAFFDTFIGNLGQNSIYVFNPDGTYIPVRDYNSIQPGENTEQSDKRAGSNSLPKIGISEKVPVPGEIAVDSEKEKDKSKPAKDSLEGQKKKITGKIQDSIDAAKKVYGDIFDISEIKFFNESAQWFVRVDYVLKEISVNLGSTDMIFSKVSDIWQKITFNALAHILTKNISLDDLETPISKTYFRTTKAFKGTFKKYSNKDAEKSLFDAESIPVAVGDVIAEKLGIMLYKKARNANDLDSYIKENIAFQTQYHDRFEGVGLERFKYKSFVIKLAGKIAVLRGQIELTEDADLKKQLEVTANKLEKLAKNIIFPPRASENDLFIYLIETTEGILTDRIEKRGEREVKLKSFDSMREKIEGKIKINDEEIFKEEFKNEFIRLLVLMNEKGISFSEDTFDSIRWYFLQLAISDYQDLYKATELIGNVNQVDKEKSEEFPVKDKEAEINPWQAAFAGLAALGIGLGLGWISGDFSGIFAGQGLINILYVPASILGIVSVMPLILKSIAKIFGIRAGPADSEAKRSSFLNLAVPDEKTTFFEVKDGILKANPIVSKILSILPVFMQETILYGTGIAGHEYYHLLHPGQGELEAEIKAYGLTQILPAFVGTLIFGGAVIMLNLPAVLLSFAGAALAIGVNGYVLKANHKKLETLKKTVTVLDNEKIKDIKNKIKFRGDEYKGRKLSVEVLGANDLLPKYMVTIRNRDFYLSDIYLDQENRPAVVGYIKNNIEYDMDEVEGFYAVTYYLSKSQAAWRVLPAYNVKEGEVDYYDKGESEESVTLPFALQRVLSVLSNTNTRKVKKKNDRDLIFFGTANRSEQNLHLNSFSILVPEKKKSDFGTGENEELVSYEDIIIQDPENEPDFKQYDPAKTFIQKSQLYGKVTKEIYSSKNGLLNFMVSRDQKGRVWLNVEISEKNTLENQIGIPLLTKYGVAHTWVDAGSLTQPAYEYPGPAGKYGEEQKQHKGYVDIYEPYLKNIKTIMEYNRISEKRKSQIEETGDRNPISKHLNIFKKTPVNIKKDIPDRYADGLGIIAKAAFLPVIFLIHVYNGLTLRWGKPPNIKNERGSFRLYKSGTHGIVYKNHDQLVKIFKMKSVGRKEIERIISLNNDLRKSEKGENFIEMLPEKTSAGWGISMHHVGGVPLEDYLLNLRNEGHEKVALDLEKEALEILDLIDDFTYGAADRGYLDRINKKGVIFQNFMVVPLYDNSGKIKLVNFDPFDIYGIFELPYRKFIKKFSKGEYFGIRSLTNVFSDQQFVSINSESGKTEFLEHKSPSNQTSVKFDLDSQKDNPLAKDKGTTINKTIAWELSLLDKALKPLGPYFGMWKEINEYLNSGKVDVISKKEGTIYHINEDLERVLDQAGELNRMGARNIVITVDSKEVKQITKRERFQIGDMYVKTGDIASASGENVLVYYLEQGENFEERAGELIEQLRGDQIVGSDNLEPLLVVGSLDTMRIIGGKSLGNSARISESRPGEVTSWKERKKVGAVVEGLYEQEINLVLKLFRDSVRIKKGIGFVKGGESILSLPWKLVMYNAKAVSEILGKAGLGNIRLTGLQEEALDFEEIKNILKENNPNMRLLRDYKIEKNMDMGKLNNKIKALLGSVFEGIEVDLSSKEDLSAEDIRKWAELVGRDKELEGKLINVKLPESLDSEDFSDVLKGNMRVVEEYDNNSIGGENKCVKVRVNSGFDLMWLFENVRQFSGQVDISFEEGVTLNGSMFSKAAKSFIEMMSVTPVMAYKIAVDMPVVRGIETYEKIQEIMKQYGIKAQGVGEAGLNFGEEAGKIGGEEQIDNFFKSAGELAEDLGETHASVSIREYIGEAGDGEEFKKKAAEKIIALLKGTGVNILAKAYLDENGQNRSGFKDDRNRIEIGETLWSLGISVEELAKGNIRETIENMMPVVKTAGNEDMQKVREFVKNGANSESIERILSSMKGRVKSMETTEEIVMYARAVDQYGEFSYGETYEMITAAKDRVVELASKKGETAGPAEFADIFRILDILSDSREAELRGKAKPVINTQHVLRMLGAA